MREEAGLSRSALARILGVGPTFVGNVEEGRATLPEKHVASWAKALGADPNEIGRWVGGEVRLTGLSTTERAEVIALVERYRACHDDRSDGMQTR